MLLTASRACGRFRRSISRYDARCKSQEVSSAGVAYQHPKLSTVIQDSCCAGQSVSEPRWDRVLPSDRVPRLGHHYSSSRRHSDSSTVAAADVALVVVFLLAGATLHSSVMAIAATESFHSPILDRLLGQNGARPTRDSLPSHPCRNYKIPTSTGTRPRLVEPQHRSSDESDRQSRQLRLVQGQWVRCTSNGFTRGHFL